MGHIDPVCITYYHMCFPHFAKLAKTRQDNLFLANLDLATVCLSNQQIEPAHKQLRSACWRLAIHLRIGCNCGLLTFRIVSKMVSKRDGTVLFHVLRGDVLQLGMIRFQWPQNATCSCTPSTFYSEWFVGASGSHEFQADPWLICCRARHRNSRWPSWRLRLKLGQMSDRVFFSHGDPCLSTTQK